MRLYRPFRSSLLYPLLIVAATGCVPVMPVTESSPTPSAATVVAPTATQPTATPVEEPTEDPAMSSTPAAASAPEPVRQAITDLAERLSVAEDTIEVVTAEAVVWPDGSLGCPEPGMMYAQVIVEGMKIILEVDGEEYHYHYGADRGPFLCENPVESGAGAATSSSS